MKGAAYVKILVDPKHQVADKEDNYTHTPQDRKPHVVQKKKKKGPMPYVIGDNESDGYAY